MSALRPLPPRPSLEFEHKEAKALLRRLRAGDPDATARALARQPEIRSRDRIRLADAQLVIAREYGFTSWPRLVHYFEDVERQRHRYHGSAPRQGQFYEGWVRTLLADHRERRSWAGRALVAYVPRFYGMRVEDVFDATVQEDEARLAVARQYGYPSWDALLDGALTKRDSQSLGDALRVSGTAIEAGDLDALKTATEAHPELLQPTDDEIVKGATLFSIAIHQESVVGKDAMRPISAWLSAQGLDRQRELNLRLCGHMMMDPPSVRRLLDQGADPNWVASNGIPVLEHALIRYWNGEAVDLVAARARPRKALWISAGLGDVPGVARFLDANGAPTAAARRRRPPFDAVGPVSTMPLPEADDEEILVEAFYIAMVNRRINVLDYMIGRGFPVNALVFGAPMINLAAGNLMTDVVECLVRGGADPDLRGWRPDQSAREIARWLYVENEPTRRTPQVRRVVELLGMNPDAL